MNSDKNLPISYNLVFHQNNSGKLLIAIIGKMIVKRMTSGTQLKALIDD